MVISMNLLDAIWKILGVIGTIAAIYMAGVRFAEQLGYFSWWGICIRSRKLLKKIKNSRFFPDLVIGVGRSGAVLGGILAGNLGVIPITIVDRRYDWIGNTRQVIPLIFVKEQDVRGKRILLVDAAPHTGETLRVLKNKLMQFQPVELHTASLFKVKYSVETPDYYIKEVKKVKKMPWRFTKDYIEDFVAPQR